MQGLNAPAGSTLLVARDYPEYRSELYLSPNNHKSYVHIYPRKFDGNGEPILDGVYRRQYDLEKEHGLAPGSYWAVFHQDDNPHCDEPIMCGG